MNSLNCSLTGNTELLASLTLFERASFALLSEASLNAKSSTLILASKISPKLDALVASELSYDGKGDIFKTPIIWPA